MNREDYIVTWQQLLERLPMIGQKAVLMSGFSMLPMKGLPAEFVWMTTAVHI